MHIPVVGLTIHERIYGSLSALLRNAYLGKYGLKSILVPFFAENIYL